LLLRRLKIMKHYLKEIYFRKQEQVEI